MPYSIDDLGQLKVRIGTGQKSLKEMSDNQFTAWLRAIGAEGTMTVVKIGPGKFMTPLEDRVRIINELEANGFQVPGLSDTASVGRAETRSADISKLTSLRQTLRVAASASRSLRGSPRSLERSIRE